MREIHVKNASVFGRLAGHDIDFEIRDGNDNRGLALSIDGVPIIDFDATPSGTIKDAGLRPTVFELHSVKGNGCLSVIRIENGKIHIQ
jgi:hypothetical protein